MYRQKALKHDDATETVANKQPIKWQKMRLNVKNKKQAKGLTSDVH